MNPNLATLTLLLAAPLSTPAAIHYAFELNSETNSFSTAPFPLLSTNSSAAVRSTPASQSFSAAFSTLGEQQLSVTYSAPPGQMFVIESPLGFDSTILTVGWSGGSGGASAGVFSDTSPTVLLTGATGGLNPSSSDVVLIGSPGDTYYFTTDFDLTPGQTYTFKSLTISTTVPASYNNDFIMEPGFPSLIGRASTFSAPPDPGQWVYLAAAPIPEPSRAILALTGILALALTRRR